MPRRAKAKDLRRSTAKKPEKKTVWIFCEGEKSEPLYLKGVKQLPEVRSNTAIQIEIDRTQGVPSTLVAAAIDLKKRHKEIDEIWCAFDVEWPIHHPALIESINLAKASGIKVALSNPNFEIWLLLHFHDQTAFLENGPAESLSKSFDKRNDKNIDASLYMPHRKLATDRARKLHMKHEKDQSACPNNNPSSGMFMLMEALDPSMVEEAPSQK